MFGKLFAKVNQSPRNKRYLLVGLALLFSYLLVAILETKLIIGRHDVQITTIVQSIVPRAADLPFSFISLLGSLETTTLIVLLIFLVIYRTERRLFFSLGLFSLIMVFEYLGKILIYHPNPPKFFFRYVLPFTTPHYVSSHFSFPSGHEARTTFIVMVMVLLIRRRIGQRNLQWFLNLCLISYLVIMSISRVSLGEHWGSDVLGGALLGAGFAFLTMLYY